MSFNLPSGYNLIKMPNMSPEAEGSYNRSVGQVGRFSPGITDLLGRLGLGDESAFSALEKPAISAFQQSILPSIAEKFNAGGMLRSGAFANAASQAGSSLAERLNAQRAGIQQSAIDRLLGLEESLLSKSPYSFGLQDKKKSSWETLLGILPQLAQAAGHIAPLFL